KDSGIGISQEEQKQIFDRFYQVDSREMNLGSGIGLAFTKKLVELHHGSIHVESEKERGTVFTVRIPISDDSYKLEELLENQLVIEHAIEPSPDIDGLETGTSMMSPAEEPARESLLIVDDNQEIVDYLHHYFGKQYDIKIAFNGKEELNLLEDETLYLIISDVMMPEIDSIQL